MTERSSIGLGTTLADRYELVGELAEGAMGMVYRARDHTDGALVAVKVLRAEHLTDGAMRRRLRREAAALKSLDHPAIVRLLELGFDEGGAVFLVTEYVEGGTLAERLAEGPLSLPEADALVAALAGGIDAAHVHGILHGDLKPANVLWPADADAIPRVVDFGASKILGLDRLTATGEITGTPAYLAPEVLTGEAEVDARIDVYGLGVLLYEALSGRRAFDDGHIGRLLAKIDSGDCLPLDAVADVSSSVANVVARAMHRRRQERYDSMRAAHDAWQQARTP